MTPLPTWRYLLEHGPLRAVALLAHAVLWGVMNLSTLLPGLIARAFFDTLTGPAAIPRRDNRADRAAGRARRRSGGAVADRRLRRDHLPVLVSGLVRRNLLRHVLDRPGALALPYSIGETISRFRDDVTRPRTAWIGPTRSSARG